MRSHAHVHADITETSHPIPSTVHARYAWHGGTDSNNRELDRPGLEDDHIEKP